MAETIPVRFDILLAYAERHGLDFNELCRTVRDAIAEGSAATQGRSNPPIFVANGGSDGAG